MAITFVKRTQASLFPEDENLLNTLENPSTKLGLKLSKLKEILAPKLEDHPQWVEWTVGAEKAVAEGAPEGLTVANVSRKWELVSAYQKAVRRGEVDLAVRMAGAMQSMEAEHKYMTRRIGTVAAEDVGAGNPLLMKFVLAAFATYTPTTLGPAEVRGLWQYLTRLMCASKKSRLYCRLSVLQETVSSELPYPSFDNHPVRDVVTMDTRMVEVGSLAEATWLTSGKWRAEGMAVGPVWHAHLPKEFQKLEKIEAPVLPTTMLAGVPTYSYDTHTRIGGQVLMQMAKMPEYAKLFPGVDAYEARKALGLALFYEEGGLVPGSFENLQLIALEQRVMAERHSMSFDAWMELRSLMKQSLHEGLVDKLRTEIVRKRY